MMHESLSTGVYRGHDLLSRQSQRITRGLSIAVVIAMMWLCSDCGRRSLSLMSAGTELAAGRRTHTSWTASNDRWMAV